MFNNKSKKINHSSINLLRNMHGSVILLWFISVFLMFFTERFKIPGALFLLLIGIANIKGICPLTRLEEKLLKSFGGHKEAKNFTPKFLKKYFKIKISYKTTLATIIIFSLIALFYLIKEFIL